ncbi:MAG TPA: hypothetical protein VFS16_00660 [Acidimicrobiia bacterium]|nr:hypothetical protein [Acidimicrobiia bacterium]
MTVDVTETENPSVDRFAEFPGLPDLPEVVDLPEVIDLRDGVEPVATVPETAGTVVDLREGPEVPLHRLLERAKPSLAEAAALAAVVLDALGTMHEAGCAHGDLDSASVRVGLGGDVRLAGGKPVRAGAARFDADQRRADIRAAAGIVAEIVRAAGRPARPLTEREERLLARLESAGDARSLARRGPLRASRGLEQVLGPADRRRAARRGVIELTRAVAGTGTEATNGHHPVVGGGHTGPDGVAGRPARSLPPPSRRPPISPRVWKAAAVAAGVLLILGVEIHFFGDDVQRNVEKILGGNAGAASSEAKRFAPIPNLAPPAAGPITHLELRPLEGCRPGALCQTVAQITVTPQDTPLEVAWGFELLDRCGPARESRPGGVFSIPPRADRAVQTVSVPLPAGRALALIPLTSSPVKVAGTPIPVSTGDRAC